LAALIGHCGIRRQRSRQFPAFGGTSSPLPKDAAISYQAGRMRLQRRPVSVFEPGIVFGAKVETIEIPCFQKMGKG